MPCVQGGAAAAIPKNCFWAAIGLRGNGFLSMAGGSQGAAERDLPLTIITVIKALLPLLPRGY